MSYAFLTEPNSEDQITRYFAIPEDKIETLRASQTYDSFGQKVGTYNCGDSIEFKTSKAVDLANEIAKAQDENYDFKIGDIVNGYDNSDVFDLIEEAFDKAGLQDGQDYDLFAEPCEGFDFWDGNNWQTIVTERESGADTFFVLVTDDSLVDALNKAIDEMEFVESSAGSKTYKGGGFVITESFWQGHWETYSITAE